MVPWISPSTYTSVLLNQTLYSRSTTLEHYTEVAAGTLAVNRSTVASLAFLVWDILLTFDDEVRVIWRTPWSLMKILYYIIRYLAVCTQISTLFVGGVLTRSIPFTTRDCFIWQVFEGIAASIVMISTDTILILRVRALYNGNKTIQRVLGALYVIEAIFMVVGLRVTLPTMQFDQMCRVTEAPTLLALVVGPPIAFQTVLFVLTGIKFVQAVRAGWGDVPLLVILMRDGTWAFFVLFVVLVTDVGLFEGRTGAYSTILYGWLLTSFSVCGYRILLNILDLNQHHSPSGVRINRANRAHNNNRGDRDDSHGDGDGDGAITTTTSNVSPCQTTTDLDIRFSTHFSDSLGDDGGAMTCVEMGAGESLSLGVGSGRVDGPGYYGGSYGGRGWSTTPSTSTSTVLPPPPPLVRGKSSSRGLEP